jgi:hypothetical protein
MTAAPWSQPTLGGASVRAFAIAGTFSWPAGWRGSLTVIMEGEPDRVTLVEWNELTTSQLYAVLDRASELLAALLGDD